MNEKAKHKDGYYNCTCPICGNKFHRKPYTLSILKTKPCCSRECLRKYKKILMSGEGNHQYGLINEKNATWKGGKTHTGYIRVRVPGHPFSNKKGYVLEHRLVAEKYLLNEENSVCVDGKRYLSPDYVVHHINFDRGDNSIENLAVMKHNEHVSLHNRLNPSKKDKKTGRIMKDNSFIKIRKVTETGVKPERQTTGSAGYDLCVDSDKEIIIESHKSVVVGSGIAFAIPKGYCGLVFARSWISTKRGIRPSTCVSVIDSDYRGEVMLPLYNDSDFPQVIKPYERVGQMIIIKPYYPEIEIVDSLDETDRGEDGFGSTGR